MTAKVLKAYETPSRASQGAPERKSGQGVIARWFAEVLEKGQTLNFLEYVGGL